jgi:hypothetical protein
VSCTTLPKAAADRIPFKASEQLILAGIETDLKRLPGANSGRVKIDEVDRVVPKMVANYVEIVPKE